MDARVFNGYAVQEITDGVFLGHGSILNKCLTFLQVHFEIKLYTKTNEGVFMPTIKMVWKHAKNHKGKLFWLNKKHKKNGDLYYQFENIETGKELSQKQGGVFTSPQKAKAAKWSNNQSK